ncbi:cell filamentation protein Fic [Sediminicola luteus]|uniref:Cell filamentation protein Fic n=1 Tax=Sediminicola luteus TaxID=319238 RepID=A0A2A4GFK3_9FLAO|nr:cell filamentation protein Fic [Sediminicola luteus]
MVYLHQRKDWPNFDWDNETLLPYVSQARNLQGRLIGRMEGMGFELQEEAVLETLTDDIVKTSEIEGELLNPQEVRSSVARRLGMDISGLPEASRDVEGVVEMMLDATQNFKAPFSKDRLCGWHAALFPTGRSGLYKIIVGDWRDDKKGPMQVVSGPMGSEKVHYTAPTASRLENEMNAFIEWFNTNEGVEPIIKSAVAHLWFVSIHPFDDGNGRIARAIGDCQLARADRTNQRFYSMSAQIMKSKNGYYNILESTQKGSMDVTHWLVWYFERLIEALTATDELLSKILVKAKFWEQHKTTLFNARQVYMINKLHGDFIGKLHSSKWAKMTKVHRDTALRDIQDLVEKGVLLDSGEGGRSTNYILNLPES